jgi:hypothetical protein
MRRTSFLLSVFGLILVLSVAPIQAREGSAAPVSDWPEDARSTTGPIPPTGIERGYQAARAPLAQAILNDVPAYLWHHGCGPTAAGMVVGYWDGHGFDDLVSGSAAAQTAAVNAMISSQGNYSDYCCPSTPIPTCLLTDQSRPLATNTPTTASPT